MGPNVNVSGESVVAECSFSVLVQAKCYTLLLGGDLQSLVSTGDDVEELDVVVPSEDGSLLSDSSTVGPFWGRSPDSCLGC